MAAPFYKIWRTFRFSVFVILPAPGGDRIGAILIQFTKGSIHERSAKWNHEPDRSAADPSAAALGVRGSSPNMQTRLGMCGIWLNGNQKKYSVRNFSPEKRFFAAFFGNVLSSSCSFGDLDFSARFKSAVCTSVSHLRAFPHKRSIHPFRLSASKVPHSKTLCCFKIFETLTVHASDVIPGPLATGLAG